MRFGRCTNDHGVPFVDCHILLEWSSISKRRHHTGNEALISTQLSNCRCECSFALQSGNVAYTKLECPEHLNLINPIAQIKKPFQSRIGCTSLCPPIASGYKVRIRFLSYIILFVLGLNIGKVQEKQEREVFGD